MVKVQLANGTKTVGAAARTPNSSTLTPAAKTAKTSVAAAPKPTAAGAASAQVQLLEGHLTQTPDSTTTTAKQK